MNPDEIIDKLNGFVEDVFECLEPKPVRVVPTEPGLDLIADMECGGYLWARVIGVDKIQTQKKSARERIGCEIQGWIINAQVGILRCVSGLSNSGKAPKASEVEVDGIQGINDMGDISNALLANKNIYRVTSWEPRGPEGNVAGGIWNFQFIASACSSGCSHGTS